jgi:cyclohexanecarboxyl-CoA dehydrogenase
VRSETTEGGRRSGPAAAGSEAGTVLDFSFTEEQEELRRVLREFATKELRPRYAEWDRTATFPWELWQQLGELGVPGITVSEAYGGSGLGPVEAGIAAEEIARGDFNCAYAVILGGLVGGILENFGSAVVREQYLVPMARGRRVVGIAVTEAQAGSDVAEIRTRTEPVGGGVRLYGEKTGISLAMVADAFVVLARSGIEAGRPRFSAWLVPADSAGVVRQPFDDTGNRPIGRGALFFDGVDLPETYRLGAEGEGLRIVLGGFDLSRVLIALQCLGAAEASLDETREWVGQRRAFGRTLAEFEAVSFRLARHYATVDTLRWYCYRALWLRQAGRPHTVEAAICKWLAPRAAFEAIHDALLLHGQYGYTKDLPFEQRLRDVMGLEIGDGTREVQELIVARHLLGRRL